MKKLIVTVFFTLIILPSIGQYSQDKFNASWLQLGPGIAYKGIIGVDINGFANLNLVKLNQGKIRLSVFNELGTGPSTLGFGWYSSNATMMSVSLHKLYKEYGVSFSNGYEVSYLNSPAGTEKWSGFNSYRIGVLYSDYLEIYGHMNYDMEDEFRNIITLELGVKYYLDFL